MMDRNRCPECGTHDTYCVHTEWYTDIVEETRVCNECVAEFRNKYNMFEQTLEQPSQVPRND